MLYLDQTIVDKKLDMTDRQHQKSITLRTKEIKIISASYTNHIILIDLSIPLP